MAEVQDSNHNGPAQSTWAVALREAGVAVGVAAVLLATFYVSAFRWIHPEFAPFTDRAATPLMKTGRDFIPISIGGYRLDADSLIIENFNGDEAIFALPQSFYAEDYPFIKVELEGLTRYSKLKLMWRRSEDLATTYSLTINHRGGSAAQLAMTHAGAAYRGHIQDVALLFYDGATLGHTSNDGANIHLTGLEFRPFAARRVLEQMLDDLMNPPLLSNSSINYVAATHQEGLVNPHYLLLSILLCGVLLLSLQCLIPSTHLGTGKTRMEEFARRIVFLTLICWMAGDAYRKLWLVEQYSDSYARFWNQPLQQQVSNSRLRCERRFRESKCALHLLPHF